VIPDEAVEAAMVALGIGPHGISRVQLELALEAAAPHLMAVALDEAADRIMGPSDVPLDAATCRWNAMELRETAAHLRTPDA
jgi:hypothetical protein